MAIELTENQKRTLWLIRVRWWAILTMLLILAFLFFSRNLKAAYLPAFLCVAAAAGYNLIFPYLVKRFPCFSSNPLSIYLRMLADITVVTLLVHFTGGIESPFNLFYLLELASVSIFGLTWLGYLISLHAAVFYTVACGLEAAGVISHYRAITVPGTLYLSLDYVYYKSFSLFILGVLIVYLSSYLSNRVREKTSQIEELFSSRLDFMNMAVHELRSPLTSIKEYVSLLVEGLLGALNPREKETLESISRQVIRLNKLINELLDVARLDSGKARFERAPCSIAEPIEAAVRDLDPQLSLKGLIVLKSHSSNLPQVKMDKEKILEVVLNLLGNAIKFSPHGGKIVICADLIKGGAGAGNEIRVSIKDEGNGILPEDVPHIFQKFYRARHEDPRYKGTGLGLAISKGIIERHDGKIWAESKGLGQGATFYFTLPLK